LAYDKIEKTALFAFDVGPNGDRMDQTQGRCEPYLG
jgi:hypothetical protein